MTTTNLPTTNPTKTYTICCISVETSKKWHEQDLNCKEIGGLPPERGGVCIVVEVHL